MRRQQPRVARIDFTGKSSMKRARKHGVRLVAKKEYNVLAAYPPVPVRGSGLSLLAKSALASPVEEMS